ncbi:MAG: hypothetical protein ACRDTF_09890 [Pseudonocardiaceae bacterium]
MVFDRGLIGLILWLAVVGVLVLMAMFVVWMVQARASHIPAKDRWDKRVPYGITGQSGEGAR